ncbi:right-handed parallel beta-helix repeat-containing protein [Pedobacter sp. UC225_61]|uniref:right-handed parallel beta-helix repeat-containing protein n=1 Tax=Pedobacter sp. UC225_61 TaxID=3374623 RepID=UPI00379BBF73
MANNTHGALLKRGIESTVAQNLVEAGYTIERLQYKTLEDLIALGIPEVQSKKLLDGRPPIPDDTFSQVLHDSKHVCCICREASRGIIIHHIEEWAMSRSHDYDNLVVLCSLHHDEAHTKRYLTIVLSSDKIRFAREKWYAQVKAHDTAVITGNLIPELENQEISEVEVSDVEQLINSLKSNTIIRLKEGKYNLSDIAKYDSNPNVRWRTVFNGYEPHIENIKNLKIVGEGMVELLINPSYAWVLRFNNSLNIEITNITAGHTTPGSCTGGVFIFNECHRIKISNCDLYGCGTYGLTFNKSSNATINKTIVRECTYGIAQFFNSSKIIFRDCSFLDCKEFDLLTILEYCEDISFLTCNFHNNYISWDERYFIETDRTCKDIVIEYSEIKNNKVLNWSNEPEIILTRHNDYSNNNFQHPEDRWYFDDEN